MPYFRASFYHTFNSGDLVELTSDAFKANSWEQAEELAKAFGFENVRIAVADIDQQSGKRTEYPRLTSVE